MGLACGEQLGRGGSLLMKYMHCRGGQSCIEGDFLMVLFDIALHKQAWVVDIWEGHGVLSYWSPPFWRSFNDRVGSGIYFSSISPVSCFVRMQL